MQYFPIKWKTAKIIPICKAGKPPDLASGYRPISLLSSLSKIYEKILKEKNNYLLKYSPINNLVFGDFTLRLIR